MKKMLISSSDTGGLRIATMEGNQLYDLDIERLSSTRKKGNIYLGKVRTIEPSLNAAFIDYGAERQGFLPIKEVAPCYIPNRLSGNDPTKLSIQDVLKEGQQILVEIKKDERGNKGAAMSTFINLAGSYLVLMPQDPGARGVSRRVEPQDKNALKAVLDQLDLPPNMGAIARTAGVGKSAADLQWDLQSLLAHWQAILDAADQHHSFQLIHQESDILMRAIRDYLTADIMEIITDTQEIFDKAKCLIERIKPDFRDRLHLHQEKTPLFTYHNIEHQIQNMYQREISLPSGGSIAIDHTEALVAIDINSARATAGGDIEETALNTNMEAAQEIARQLRLRDIGGLIVIDFIDMTPIEHQRKVEHHLRTAVQSDRARVQISRISRFGLLEVSRQRLYSSFGEAHQKKCPRCNGRGNIQSVEALSVSLLHLLEETAFNEKMTRIHLHAPVNVSTFILNEKRNELTDIEHRQQIKIIIIPTPHLESPHHKIERFYEDGKSTQQSYKMVSSPEVENDLSLAKNPNARNRPVVGSRLPESPPPKKEYAFMKRALTLLKIKNAEAPKPPVNSIPSRHRPPTNRSRNRNKPQEHRSPSKRSRVSDRGRRN